MKLNLPLNTGEILLPEGLRYRKRQKLVSLLSSATLAIRTVEKGVARVVSRGPGVLKGPEKYTLGIFLCFQFAASNLPTTAIFKLVCTR